MPLDGLPPALVVVRRQQGDHLKADAGRPARGPGADGRFPLADFVRNRASRLRCLLGRRTGIVEGVEPFDHRRLGIRP
jgi:hypothetical protein